jgi:hypothetical protein
MDMETPIPDMNEIVFCRIELAHSVAGCSTDILPTFLQLDMLFPGHTISPHKTLLYLRSCPVCMAKCKSFVDVEGRHPYLFKVSIQESSWNDFNLPERSGNNTSRLMQQSDSEYSSEHDLGLIEEFPQLRLVNTIFAESVMPDPSQTSDESTSLLTEEAHLHVTSQLHEVIQEFDTPAARTYTERSLIAPWSSSLEDAEAPEDVDNPQPSVFATPLSYMDKTFDQAVS